MAKWKRYRGMWLWLGTMGCSYCHASQGQQLTAEQVERYQALSAITSYQCKMYQGSNPSDGGKPYWYLSVWTKTAAEDAKGRLFSVRPKRMEAFRDCDDWIRQTESDIARANEALHPQPKKVKQ